MDKKNIVLFIGGLFFGFGLAWGGMSKPEIVLSFLQLKDYGLTLLMGAATWKYQPDGFLYYRVAGWNYHDRPITSGPMSSG